MPRRRYRLPPVQCLPGAHALIAAVCRGLAWVRVGKVANDNAWSPWGGAA